jgi:hypothetical protein
MTFNVLFDLLQDKYIVYYYIMESEVLFNVEDKFSNMKVV